MASFVRTDAQNQGLVDDGKSGHGMASVHSIICQTSMTKKNHFSEVDMFPLDFDRCQIFFCSYFFGKHQKDQLVILQNKTTKQIKKNKLETKCNITAKKKNNQIVCSAIYRSSRKPKQKYLIYQAIICNPLHCLRCVSDARFCVFLLVFMQKIQFFFRFTTVQNVYIRKNNTLPMYE